MKFVLIGLGAVVAIVVGVVIAGALVSDNDQTYYRAAHAMPEGMK